jgi:hypothetical protein
MLDSRPVRAQAPIVSGRNLTFAAARIWAASASVIQSAAAGTGQSPPDEEPDDEPDEGPDEFDDEDEDEEPESDPDVAPSPFDAPSPDEDVEAFAALEPPRSFFAQPEPL